MSGASLLAARDWSGSAPKPDAAVDVPKVAEVVAPTIRDPDLVEFIRAAHHADESGDPLQRCLSFPSWPGNAWPAGLAAAHCHLAFDPVPSLADVGTALDSGDLATLDARYQALLDSHFDAVAPNEGLHLALERFDISADADVTSARWLELAPDSAWARLARGAHLHAVAAHLLEDGEDGPAAPSDRAAGAALAVEATTLYQDALAIEPRLMPAHAGVAGLALAIGDDAAAVEALVAGEAIDPACLALVHTRIAQLGPRHGGTAEAAHAHLAALRAAHPQRVLLALAAADEALAGGRSMLHHERFAEAQRELRPALTGTTSPEAFEDAAIASVRAPMPDHDAALGMLVAASRYQTGRTVVRELRARLLMEAGERTWALSILNDVPAEPAAMSRLLAVGPRRITEPL
ncbi:MAG: hypothetical protein ACREO3_07695, partial [Arenimonas sp.]